MGLLIHRLFLCFGTSILIASNLSKTRKIDDSGVRVASSFLYLSIVLLILPSIFRLSSPDSGILGILKISRWCAVFLFILLFCLLFYTLKTEIKFWDSADAVRCHFKCDGHFRPTVAYSCLLTSSNFFNNAFKCDIILKRTQSLNRPRLIVGVLIVFILIGLVFGAISSWLFVKSSIWVSQNWGLGYTFIAGILLPIGTYHVV